MVTRNKGLIEFDPLLTSWSRVLELQVAMYPAVWWSNFAYLIVFFTKFYDWINQNHQSKVQTSSMQTSFETLQQVTVLIWMFLGTIPLIGTLVTMYCLFYTDYWHIVVTYLIWIYYDRDTPRNGGTRWACHWKLPFPRWYCQYFSMTLVKTTDLDASRNYLFGCHPHGIAATGMTGNLASDGNNVHLVFPGLKTNFTTNDFAFFVPLFRELLLAVGGCSVSRESIGALLRRVEGGNIVLIVPGGAREVLYSRPGVNELYLKNHKGFIRVAIQNGAPVVPVYSFGETEIYSPLCAQKGSWLRAFQEKYIDLTGIPPAFINGRGIFQNSFGILPRRVAVTTVVGSPIVFTQMDYPTEEYVNVAHGKYVDALVNLYNKYKDQYGNGNSELIIS